MSLLLCLSFISFLVLICYVSYKCCRDLSHPCVITSAVWIIVISIYQLYCSYDSKYLPLSINFYLVLLSYLAPFIIISTAVGTKKYAIPKYLIYSNIRQIKLIRCLSLVSIVVIFYLVYRLVKITNRHTLFEIIMEIRKIIIEKNQLPADMKICTYFIPLAVVIFFSVQNYYKNAMSRLFVMILLLSIIMVSTLMATKGSIIQLVCCILYFLYKNKKLTKKRIIIIAGIGVLCLNFIQYSRSPDKTMYNIDEMFFVYVLSPLPALDLVLNGSVSYSTNPFGIHSFGFVYRVLQRIHIIGEIRPQGLWVQVPYLTNVYTLLGPYYMDFKIMGTFLCGTIYGTLWGFCYSLTRRNSHYFTVMYGLYIYCLIFQFFGDWFFGFFSITLQHIFYNYIVNTRIRVK
jgi:oligosaccharide repeat unit polymerase